MSRSIFATAAVILLAAVCCRPVFGDDPKKQQIELSPKLQPLIRQLGDVRESVQEAAVEEIAKLGAGVIASLVGRLGDPDDNLGYGLWLALQRFGDTAVPHLVNALKCGDDRRTIKAISVLGALRQRATRAVPDLLGLASHRNYKVREAVMEALGSIKDPRAIPTMLRVARIDSEQHVAECALSNLTLFPGAVLSDHLPTLVALGTSTDKDIPGRVKSMAFTVLAEAGAVAVPHLVKLIDDPKVPERVRLSAIRSVYDMASSNDRIRETQGAIPSLIRVLEEGRPTPRLEAAAALGRIGPIAKEALPKLEKLAREGSRGDRAQLAGYILRIDPSRREAMTILFRLAEQKQDGHARHYALERLREFAKHAADGAPKFISWLDDPESFVREKACYILAELPTRDQNAIAKIKHLSSADPDQGVRRAAGQALERIQIGNPSK